MLGLGEVGEREIDVALGDHAQAALLAVGDLARPAEPDPAAAFGERVGERDREPAGARLARGGGAVRSDDKASHARGT